MKHCKLMALTLALFLCGSRMAGAEPGVKLIKDKAIRGHIYSDLHTSRPNGKPGKVVYADRYINFGPGGGAYVYKINGRLAMYPYKGEFYWIDWNAFLEDYAKPQRGVGCGGTTSALLPNDPYWARQEVYSYKGDPQRRVEDKLPQCLIISYK